MACNFIGFGSLAGLFNDGKTFRNILDGDHYPSTAPCSVDPVTGLYNLTAFPPAGAIGVAHDGDLLPLEAGAVAVKKDLSDCYVSGDADETLLFQIQDLTIGGKYYESAVIVWFLQNDEAFVELKFEGKDVELGIALPEAKDTDGKAVFFFFALGEGEGVIAEGHIEMESGKLTGLFELVSVSCKGPWFNAFDVPATMVTTAFGGNDRGDIVGSYLDPPGVRRGFLRARHGDITTIQLPEDWGAQETHATDINNRGDVVGRYRSTVPGPWRGFLLSRGQYERIDCSDVWQTRPESINSRGDIVGSIRDGDGWHGFLLKERDCTRIDYPPFPVPVGATYARGINDRGDIVGYYYAGGAPHGFLRSKSGAFASIDYAGAAQTTAHGINNRGDIVGTFQYETADNSPHGFFLEKGKFTRIDVPCGVRTWGYDITNRGDLIGSFLDPDGVAYGFSVAADRPRGDDDEDEDDDDS